MSQKQEEKKITRLPLFGIPKLMPYVRSYMGKMAVLIILGFISSAADSIYPLFNRYALDHFIAGRTLQGLGLFIGLYLLTGLVQNLLDLYSLTECGRVEMSVNRDLRNLSFNHLQTLSFSYFNQNNVGYIHARVMSDTGKIGELVAWRMMDLVWNGAYLIGVFAAMFALNARLALVVLMLVPVAVVLVMFFERRLVTLNRKVREINSRITGNFNEGITGARSVKTLHVEKKITGDFREETLNMRRTAVRTGHNNALFLSLIALFSSVTLSIVLWRGGLITMEGVIQIGTLSAFMTYAVNLLEPIQMIVTTLAAVIGIQVKIERFTRLLEEESEVRDTPEVVEKYGDNFNPKKENWEKLEGEVEFRDVTFQYPDGDETVLEHFNLKVPQGTNVAIVGETGAGKSTLVNLVCRFYEPTEGQVLIDGRDARERSQLWLHSSIGYVLQTPHLFSGTVRENLQYGNPEATDEQIWEALRMVSADFVVKKLEKGLDSEVGEGGDMLSTGEKQLLSFTRALLADPRILVLDEATSSIDTMTEKAIQDAIRTIIQGRTSFMIAHRLSTVVDADVILAVRDGRIVEQGTHRELMAKNGYYRSLYLQNLTVAPGT